MALFDKLKNVAKDVSKTATAVAKSAAKDLKKMGYLPKSEEELQAERERAEAIRKAAEEHKAKLEQQQKEAAEAKKRAEEQAEAERKERLAQRKELRKQYIPTISAPACESGSGVCFTYGNVTYCSSCQGENYEKLLYPDSFEYALRLYALKNELPGSECDSYDEITTEFLEAFMPAYADAANSFTYYIKKYGIGESNDRLRLFHLLSNRPARMTQQHIYVILKCLLNTPEDPDDAAYYFEKLADILQKKRTYDRSSSDMCGVMLVAGVYYHRAFRNRLFKSKNGDFCSAKEADLFDENGQLKSTGSESFSEPGHNNLFNVLALWVECSPRLKGKDSKQCGACAHWKGEREDWKEVHAVEVEPDTKGVCTFFTIPEAKMQAITAEDDTCDNFEPCKACEFLHYI